jgi:hypothetical protein
VQILKKNVTVHYRDKPYHLLRMVSISNASLKEKPLCRLKEGDVLCANRIGEKEIIILKGGTTYIEAA